MKERVANQNMAFNLTGLIVSFIIYCIKYNDPSMTGWYLTFAFAPIITLPAINSLFIRWYYDKGDNKIISIIACLTIPILTILIYFYVPEFVILLWALTFLLVNLWTVKKDFDYKIGAACCQQGYCQ